MCCLLKEYANVQMVISCNESYVCSNVFGIQSRYRRIEFRDKIHITNNFILGFRKQNIPYAKIQTACLCVLPTMSITIQDF